MHQISPHCKRKLGLVSLALGVVSLAITPATGLAQAKSQRTPLRATTAQTAPAPTPPAQSTTEPTDKLIQAQASVRGVDISSLTLDQATRRLRSRLEKQFARPIAIKVDRRNFTLHMERIGFEFDAERTAKRAYYAARDAGAVNQPLEVEPAVTFDKAALAKFTAGLSQHVSVAPRDAKLRIGLRKMKRSHSRVGRSLDPVALSKKVEELLADPDAERAITVRTTRIAPKVTAKDLARLNPTIITIDKGSFKLRVFKKLRLRHTFGVAIGMPDYPTPNGRFRIQNKTIDPAWNAPDKPWAGEYAGVKVEGGAANNPLKARWMGITNGVGIHGTGMPGSIGSRASHGCIRMRVEEVKKLYPMVPVGTPVVIR